MLLPYNVDRPTRLVPRFTYGLMAVNIAIYLLTVIHANILLPGEKANFRQLEQDLEQSMHGGEDDTDFDSSQMPDSDSVAPGSPGVPASPSSPTTPETPPMPGQETMPPSSFDSSSLGKYNFALVYRGQMTPDAYGEPSAAPQQVPNQATLDDAPPSGVAANDVASDGVAADGATSASETSAADEEITLLDVVVGTPAAKEKMKTKEGMYEVQHLIWRAQHHNDMFVLEPHPSVLNVFAYHSGAPNIWSFLTAMFLHADLLHLLGNMLFLWIFGRATEDALGPPVFLAAYFVCGYAATLLYHIMAVQFTPDSVMLPFLGASGAIAGVQGLFAPRFYRTPVSVLYTTWNGWRIFGPVTLLLTFLFVRVLELGTPGASLAYLCALAALVYFGEDELWRVFRLAAMWLIGGWVVVFDVIPAMIAIATKADGGGVAHWAHIGGLLCGLAYAFLIGANKEGKAEYLIEDARRSLDNKYAGNAIEHAQKLVAEMPEKAEGYQLLAEAYDHKKETDKALDNYELAVEKYIKSDERDQAMRVYTEVLQKHPLFILKPKTQFVVANQMAVRGHFDKAAENWAKIPFTFPDAPEGEQALLRAGQLYVERLDQKEMGLHLLNTLLERNPQTSLMTQVKTIMHRAQNPAANPLDDPLAVIAPPAPATTAPRVAQAAPVEAPTVKPAVTQAAPAKPATKPVATPAVTQSAIQQPVVAQPAVEKTVAPTPAEPLSQPLLQPIALDVVTQEADLDTNLLSNAGTPAPMTAAPAEPVAPTAPKAPEPAKEESSADDLLSMPMNFSKRSE